MLFSTTNGTVSVQAGTLNLSGGGTDTGATYSGNGTIQFGGGTRTLDVNSSITANAMFSGGTTTVNGGNSGGTGFYNAASTTVNGGAANLDGTITGLGATSLSSGTLNINGATTTATSFSQSGGTLSGLGVLMVTGTTNYSGPSTDTGSGAGTSKIVAQSAANFMGGETLVLGGATSGATGVTLELKGTSATTGVNNFNNSIDLNNGSVLQLDAGATFNDATTTGGANALLIQSTAGTAGTVTNLGTWEKTGNSSGNDTISVLFSTTNGTVSVQAGTLNLSGGGTDTGATYSGNGTIQFGGGTRTLDVNSSITANAMFSGGTTTVNGGNSGGTGFYNAASTTVNGGAANLDGTITGLGATSLSSGTLNINGATTTATSFSQSGGTLSGLGVLMVTGTTNYSGPSTDTGSGAGTSKIVAQSAANFMGGETLVLGGATSGATGVTLELKGTSATTGVNNFNNSIDLNNGSVLQLDAGATFNDATTTGGANALLIQSTAGTAGTVTNLGTWEKTGNSSGNDTISVLFSTTNGTVSVQAGTLNLSGGGTDTGATYSGNGTIQFGGGTRTLDVNSSITANAMFSGGTTTVNGGNSGGTGFYNAASTTVNGGAANLDGTITGLGATSLSSGTLNINGATTTATSFSQSGGTLSGLGVLMVTGTTNYSGPSTDTGSGAGTSKIVAQSAANFMGGETLVLGGATSGATGVTLELKGTSATTGVNNFNNSIDLNNGSVLQLDAGATFNACDHDRRRQRAFDPEHRRNGGDGDQSGHLGEDRQFERQRYDQRAVQHHERDGVGAGWHA